MNEHIKNPPVIVTGATGFIGGHLLTQLTKLGLEVHALLRGYSNIDGQQYQSVTWHEIDGTAENLNSIFAQIQPYCVFHLASKFVARHNPSDVLDIIQSNVLFASLVLEAMKQSGCRRLVNAGTSWQHSQFGGYSPSCLYAASKEAFDRIVDYYVHIENFAAITLKLFDSYGPGDTRGKILSLLNQLSETGASLAMSPGEQIIDLVHVDDVCSAFVKALDLLSDDNTPRHDSFGVTSAERMTLRQVVKIFEEETKTSLKINWGAKPYREHEIMIPWVVERTLPGWEPLISLREGISGVFGRDP